MRTYESIIIFAPEISEAQVKQEIKKFEGILEGKGATSITADVWGKKDIAYLVRKHKQGRFVCLKYETSDYTSVEALTTNLRINENVIKFQSHRTGLTARKFQGNPRRTVRPGYDDDYGDGLEAEY